MNQTVAHWLATAAIAVAALWIGKFIRRMHKQRRERRRSPISDRDV